MRTKLSVKDLELYNFVDEVLFYKWDPIGISQDQQAPRDEYQAYSSTIFSMLKQSKTLIEIADFLSSIEKDQMGLDPDNKRNLEITNMLLKKAQSD